MLLRSIYVLETYLFHSSPNYMKHQWVFYIKITYWRNDGIRVNNFLQKYLPPNKLTLFSILPITFQFQHILVGYYYGVHINLQYHLQLFCKQILISRSYIIFHCICTSITDRTAIKAQNHNARSCSFALWRPVEKPLKYSAALTLLSQGSRIKSQQIIGPHMIFSRLENKHGQWNAKCMLCKDF